MPSKPAGYLRIVVPRYGAEVVGGAERAMRALAEALTLRGWRVEVFTTTAVDEATWEGVGEVGVENDAGVTVRRFAVCSGRRRLLFRILSRWVFRAPWFVRPERLWAIVQGPYSPDLVRALARRSEKPTLFTPYLFHPVLAGLPRTSSPRLLCPAAHDEPPLRLRAVDRILRSTDGLWFHSPEERELLRRIHPVTASIPSECGVVGVECPADVDATAFARKRSLARYLYYGGRGAGGKGLDELLSGHNLIRVQDPSVQLVISGDVELKRCPEGVLVVGRLTDRERWEAIAGATAVIVPGRLESLSLLALEAWAAGRPCVVNAESPVLQGHLDRGGGGLAYRGPQQLSSAALQLLAQPNLARQLGDQGRAYVTSTYRWDLAEERIRRLIGAGGM